MGACDFSAVFSEICSSIIGGENISQVEIYSSLFDNYYRTHSDEFFSLDKSDISKRKQGKLNAHADVMAYYCQNTAALVSDIATNIIPLLSDKYALRDTFVNMVMCDSCSEEKKTDTLAATDDLPLFFANVILHSFGHNSVPKYASPDISDRIISSVPKPCKYFSGREKELLALDEMLKAHDKIFVYGIGGIGKSEFVKKYISLHKKDFANILYITYSDSIKSTVAGINFKTDKKEDTISQLFTDHLNYLRLLKNDTLIVIDNFDILPETDENLDLLLELEAKIIFTTRNNFGDDYDVFELADIDRAVLFEIAEKLKLTDTDHETLDRIFTAVHNHTLACELIIRLLKKSAHSADEILEMLSTDHVNISAQDKIRRNMSTGSAKYSEHIRQLFRLFALTTEQQKMMRFLSLAPVAGIRDTYFAQLTNTDDFTAITELDEIGLVRYDDHIISVHPLIGEAAAFDMAPDMTNCRELIEALNLEFQHHLCDPINYLRQEVILEIADRVVEFADKNNVDVYFAFLINACPYAEVFEDEKRMQLYISEMEKYLSTINDNLSKAVYYTAKASYAALFQNDKDAAIEYETKAVEFLHDFPQSTREAMICFNIYNSLGAFFTLKGDIPKANLCLTQAMSINDNFAVPDDEFLILKNNLIALEESKFQKIMESEPLALPLED